MLYFYLVASAALVLIFNNFFEIFKQPYSLWLVPLLLLAFFIGFIIIQFLIFLILIITANPKKQNKCSKVFRFFLKLCLPIIIKVARVKINFKDIEKVDQTKRMLFVCNHQHEFDPVVMLSAFPDANLAFIGKKEIYTTMKFVAKAMHRIDSLPIDRENDREAAKTIIKATKLIKEDVASVGLFPEGYVSTSCELLPLRNGSLKIATKTNVPIVVCVINNTREIPKNICRRKTEVEFRFLDVITPEQYEGMNTQELGDIIYDKINTALKEIRDN